MPANVVTPGATTTARTVIGIPANKVGFNAQDIENVQLGKQRQYIIDQYYPSYSSEPYDAILGYGSYSFEADMLQMLREAQAKERLDDNELQVVWRLSDFGNQANTSDPYFHCSDEVTLDIEYYELPEGLGDELGCGVQR